MATLQETLDEIFKDREDEFTELSLKHFIETREMLGRKVDDGEMSVEEAGKKLLESFDFMHYIKKED